ncbi:thioredoxin family protein [Domibacillus sp. 8LH]|uniref:thioredoxin family protein n=1 Tax=Domibacillus TaxID=1433999 RepID=UPI001F56D628|nr:MULTISPECIES: thioredoxin family protein [Domibacillus]MCI2255141.1 thioredoxin family protein [Domibacillus sp. PGB-M46]MCM3787122.1 thioredoxin family protein [Domibacillus indicus]
MKTAESILEYTAKPKSALYVYTSMCGTCQVAGKMLDVVEAMNTDVPLQRININYYEEIAHRFEIESVPCLLLFEQGVLKKKIYAFQSVPYIYEEIRSL